VLLHYTVPSSMGENISLQEGHEYRWKQPNNIDTPGEEYRRQGRVD
jgi:hypothetical protein